MMDTLDRYVGRVSTYLAYAGAALLGLLALLIIVDIVGRVIGTPIRGTVELAAMTVASATFLTIPYALRQRGHIRSRIIVSRLPKPLERSLERFTYLLGAAIFLYLAYVSWGAAVSAFVSGSYEGEGALRVPTYPTRWLVVIGSVVMASECLIASVRAVGSEADG